MNIHVKTSWDYIKRAPFQALAAVSVLALTFFVGTVIAILVYSTHQTLTYFETRPQIIAFLDDKAPSASVDDLKLRLESDSRIKDVKYVSKEEALEIYKKATADNPLLAELVSPTIFPASLEFSVTDLTFTQNLIDEIKKESVVSNIGFTAAVGDQGTVGDVVERLKTATLYIRAGGVVLVAILGFTSFLVLMVVIGMRIATRRSEVETLNLIGATSKFIRAPIVLEAVNYAVLGVIIGWLLAFILILYVSPTIISYFGEISVLPRDPLMFFALLGIVLVTEILLGFIIAFAGSSVALSRALREK